MTGIEVRKGVQILSRALDIVRRLKRHKIDLTQARLEMMCLEDEARLLGIPIPPADYNFHEGDDE